MIINNCLDVIQSDSNKLCQKLRKYNKNIKVNNLRLHKAHSFYITLQYRAIGPY